MHLLSWGYYFLTWLVCQDTYSIMAYMGHHDFQVDELFCIHQDVCSSKKGQVSVFSSKMIKMLRIWIFTIYTDKFHPWPNQMVQIFGFEEYLFLFPSLVVLPNKLNSHDHEVMREFSSDFCSLPKSLYFL